MLLHELAEGRVRVDGGREPLGEPDDPARLLLRSGGGGDDDDGDRADATRVGPSVVELGAGCGLVSVVVAAWLRAARVPRRGARREETQTARETEREGAVSIF